jgi:DNA invertase Pin-like site-specific DNA recombinase
MHAGTRQIGYARVSTDEQGTDPQRDELVAAGCAAILEEHASGADPARPVLNRPMRLSGTENRHKAAIPR